MERIGREVRDVLLDPRHEVVGRSVETVADLPRTIEPGDRERLGGQAGEVGRSIPPAEDVELHRTRGERADRLEVVQRGPQVSLRASDDRRKRSGGELDPFGPRDLGEPSGELVGSYRVEPDPRHGGPEHGGVPRERAVIVHR
jgi:hypothetical protein